MKTGSGGGRSNAGAVNVGGGSSTVGAANADGTASAASTAGSGSDRTSTRLRRRMTLGRMRFSRTSSRAATT